MTKKLFLLYSFLIFVRLPALAQGDELLLSHAERTNFTETTRYDEIIRFIKEIQRRSDFVTMEYFGTTVEGREIPLVILAKPQIHQPSEVLVSGKAIVFVLANIHAGEVDGKEASFPLMREILFGKLQYLLDKLVILIAPIYNADGNERIAREHRISQNGPVGGVGLSDNAQNLNLNRDYMKLEAPESNALVRNVFNRWNPHLMVDCHTTDGSYHGYALTFAPPLNPNTHPNIIAYERNFMLPSIMTEMYRKHNYLTYYFGDFVDDANPSMGWRTFDHRPRFGTNYFGLRNRFAILSEAYSYLDFQHRVDVTLKFIQAILEYTAEHAEKMIEILQDVDNETIRRGINARSSDRLGIRFEITPLPDSVIILAGAVDSVKDEQTGRYTFKKKDTFVPTMMLDYGLFQWTRTIPIPNAYILPQVYQKIVEKLLAHGITVEVLDDTLQTEVEVFVVDSLIHTVRPFQKHHETRLNGVMTVQTRTFPPGSYLVTMAQPKANLAFYLLEAESDDGLVNWDFFDDILLGQKQKGQQMEYPVYRLRSAVKIPRHVVSIGVLEY